MTPLKQTLYNGNSLPMVGYGLWKVPKEEAATTVYNAIQNGYRLFDGAADYGNEKECGDGLKKAIQDGLVKREEVWITSKLWNTNHAKDKVLPAVKKQLADWGIDYFDLYLIHFPISLEYVDPAIRYPAEWWDGKPFGKITLANDPIQGTWEGMEDVFEKGLAKNIGISNFNGSLLVDLYRYARIKPAVLQIEHHPYLTQPKLLSFCKSQNLAITAYSSFGPQSFVELNHPAATQTPSLLSHSGVNEIGKKHGKTTAQVLLRWSTQRGVAVIPKSNNTERSKENLQSGDFDLSPEDLEAISNLNMGLRFNDPSVFHPGLAIFA